MIFAKRRSRTEGREIDDTDRSFHRHERQTKDVVCVARVCDSVGKDGGPFPYGAVNKLPLNLDLLRRVRLTAPGADRVCFFVEITLQNDGAVVCRNHFGDQPQKFALQKFRVADGVDDITDSEQGGEVTRHASDLGPECRKRGWMFHSQGSECGMGRSDTQAHFGVWERFALVGQEDEFGVADADHIAVVNDFAPHGHSIHKGSVMAVEIDEFISPVHLLDRTVPARDRRVDEAQLIRFIAADGYLAVDQLLNGIGQRSCDGEEPRLHHGLRCVKV